MSAAATRIAVAMVTWHSTLVSLLTHTRAVTGAGRALNARTPSRVAALRPACERAALVEVETKKEKKTAVADAPSHRIHHCALIR